MKTIHLVTSLTESERERGRESERSGLFPEVSELVLGWLIAFGICLLWMTVNVGEIERCGNLGDRVQEMLAETTEKTPSWLLQSPTLMAPLRSTGSLEKRPRSRHPAVKCTPFYYLLLQWLPLQYVIRILYLHPPTFPDTSWDHILTIWHAWTSRSHCLPAPDSLWWLCVPTFMRFKGEYYWRSYHVLFISQ